MKFHDRTDAGKRLAARLTALGLADPVVLALPRGGVPVAAEIARALAAPLDLVIVRKLGAPGQPELAVGALVDGDPPDVVLNADVVQACELSDAALARLVARESLELARRRRAFGRALPVSVTGRTAILVDDGAATDASMKAAIRALKRRSPRQIVVAIPVAPRETAAELAAQADRLVCLEQPAQFLALGFHYRHFPQLTDEEVIATLRPLEAPAAPDGAR
ncbi:MAG: phosphoribosyltransferase [Burkholderiaceae bacterium]|nr:MAG: phosphoribosyltransferase [Burkholderiaceae bacterium]